MNRSLPVLLLFLTFTSAGRGQTAVLANQVLGAAGTTVIQQGNTWAWTVGEPFIFTLGPVSDRILTQGFHQPDLYLPVSINETALADWGLEVFPNPTADFLHVRFSPEKSGALTATVFDLLGRVVQDAIPLDQPDDSRLDCSAWMPGVYLLLLQDQHSRASATLRVVRL